MDNAMLTPFIDAAALFMLGFWGTGHCIGMCGPLVVAIPGQAGRFSAHLAYHAGRLSSYAIIGGVMGAIGSGIIRIATVYTENPLTWMRGMQLALSAAAGLFLFYFGLCRLGFFNEPVWLTIASPNRIPGWRRVFNRTSTRRGHPDLYVMGFLLGGLPCGLSYAAFAQALSSASIGNGALISFSFGLGTLPGMLAAGAGAGIFLKRFRRQADLLAGLIMIGMAANLLIRLAV